MDPRLNTFLTLCRTMHYGRAAEALNLSQPAVSKHIQALEAQYGAKLFDYSGRRLSRTRAGELLEQYASTLRYNEEKLIAAMHARPETLLRIGATKSIGDYILLAEIRRFLARQSPQKRWLFVRRYWFLDEITELARRTGRSEGAVRTTLARMRRKLRDEMQKEGIPL